MVLLKEILIKLFITYLAILILIFMIIFMVEFELSEETPFKKWWRKYIIGNDPEE
jgi:hypothetical protein